MEVKIIVYGFKKDRDTLEARMVKKRIEDLEAEFEKNSVSTRVIWR